MRRETLRWILSVCIVVSAPSAGTGAEQCASPSPLVLVCPDPNIVCPNPAVEGCWGQRLELDRPLDDAHAARHMVLLRNGKLLFVESEAILVPNTEVRLWEPPDIDDPNPCNFGNYTQVAVPLDSQEPPLPIELYCSTHSQLRDGRIVFVGGGLSSFSLTVHAHTLIFDPGAAPSAPWTLMDDMPKISLDPLVEGTRWYATATTLGDGTVLVTAGDEHDAPTHTADVPLIFDATKSATSQYTELTTALQHLPFYPYMYQLSDKQVFYAGFDRRNDKLYPTPFPNTQLLDLDTQTWSDVGPQPTNGPAVMYRPDVIMKAGASDPASIAVYKIDFTATGATWPPVRKPTSTMLTARGHFQYALLPDGKVLFVGGKNSVGEVLEVELFDPDTGPPSPMDPLDSSRSHHATVALLPDGRVVAAGESSTQDVNGDWCVGVYAIQIFSPPYLFQGPRPEIVSVPVRPPTGLHPATVPYGRKFEVLVGGNAAAAVTSISMMRPTATVHANNFGQRFIPIPNTDFNVKFGTDDTLEVTAPSNKYEAPPGFYMFFILDDADQDGNEVPSKGEFVRLVECGNNVACDDGNVCTFDKRCSADACAGAMPPCSTEGCTNTDAPYGDTAMANQSCGPDGTVALPDILAVLSAFEGRYAEGCEFHNHDIAGSGQSCGGDGTIDLLDIFAVLDAFEGMPACCTSSSSQSGGSGDSAESGGEAVIILVPRQEVATAGGLFEIDVFVAEVNELRGYQLAMEIDPTVADSVTLEAVYVDGQRTDHLFAGVEYHDAIDVANGRMAASMVTGGVTPNGRAYLATFAFRVSPDVRGPSVLRVLRGGGSIMLDATGRKIDMRGDTDLSISVP